MGLKLNEEKTKKMRIDKQLKGDRIKIGDYRFLDRFKNLHNIDQQEQKRSWIRSKILNTNRPIHNTKKVIQKT